MASEVPVVEHRDPSRRSGRGRGGHPTVSRYEQRLRAAKNSGTVVRFITAVSFDTSEEFELTGQVVEIDANDILVRAGEREIWLNKLFVASTEVLS